MCFEDGDGDGYGGQATAEGGEGDLLCAGAGVSLTDTDCNDGDFGVHPDADEMSSAVAYVGKVPDDRKRQALEDILWALINTKEFLFNH